MLACSHMCSVQASGFVEMAVGMLKPFAALAQQALSWRRTRTAKTARGVGPQ